jgi:hypothetical protein
VVKNVMLDLETFGRKSGCAILSIGACAFDDDKMGKSFYRVISEPRGTVDMDTVKWWMRQSDEARGEFFNKDAVPHDKAVADFFAFFAGEKARYLWCRGASFDEPILRGAVGAPPAPWDYRDVRCVRTLYSVAGLQVFGGKDEKHIAVKDAMFQAEQAIRAMAMIRERRAANVQRDVAAGRANVVKRNRK